MQERVWEVVAVEGEWAWVMPLAVPTCGHCGAGDGCGISLWGRWLRRRPVEVKARNPIGARVGEQVAVGLEDAGLLRLAAMAYLFPTLALILGGALGEHLGASAGQLGSILGAVGGLSLALWGLRFYSVRLTHRSELHPLILRRLDQRELDVPPI